MSKVLGGKELTKMGSFSNIYTLSTPLCYDYISLSQNYVHKIMGGTELSGNFRVMEIKKNCRAFRKKFFGSPLNLKLF